MQLTIDADTSIIGAFDDAIREIFDMMIGESLHQSRMDYLVDWLQNVPKTEPALTVVVGLTGGLEGAVAITLCKEAALKWTNGLLDSAATSFDQDVIDAAGELGNMVVGGAKRRLSEYGLTMTLPNVFCAGSDSMAFPSSAKPLQVSYDFSGATVSIVTSLNKVTS